MRCWPHSSYDEREPFITREGFIRLVRSPHLKSLTLLHLYLTDIGDEGIAALIESGLLPRLRVLDLWNGTITDAGARILARAGIGHLEHLRLSKNALTEEGIALIRAACPKAETEEQYSARDIEQGQNLMEGDIE